MIAELHRLADAQAPAVAEGLRLIPAALPLCLRAGMRAHDIAREFGNHLAELGAEGAVVRTAVRLVEAMAAQGVGP